MSVATLHNKTFEIKDAKIERLANLCGQFDEHLHLIENRMLVEIACRGSIFKISGEEKPVRATRRLLQKLYQQTAEEVLNSSAINLHLQTSGIEQLLDQDEVEDGDEIAIRTRRGLIRGRGPNQKAYMEAIHKEDVSFGIGPAGTGKTWLAVACAVDALKKDQVQRIVLVRPAVEAGEKLGFLPGDMAQKVDPYLRPLYDALYEMLGFDVVERLQDRNVIEVAPLAFMRGRTLNDAFVILDEAQNTTAEQMKMFLTRIGFGSTAVITGDVTQIDLPNKAMSGLRNAAKVLVNVKGVSFTYFTSKDVVRHPMVQRIVEAYERAEEA
ncbi:MAG: PhoH family protein [Xanthomonadales bacterium]|nr:PhoH family protein [Xanthomonadales bacterium]